LTEPYLTNLSSIYVCYDRLTHGNRIIVK